MVYIGTSGWTYDHWRQRFYPPGIGRTEWLAFYAEHFRTVEINNSFYNLPSERTLRDWRDGTPDGFLFSVKASRYITHMKKLKDPVESVGRFMDRMRILGAKLGPVLFQLPPRWRFNRQRLESFLTVLPPGFRYTIELRDSSWHNDVCREVLADAGVAFCIFDLEGRLSPVETTGNFLYVRLHGPGAAAYTGSYGPDALAGWADTITAWSRRDLDVYCYFDNDQDAHAVHNALRLKGMIDGGRIQTGSGGRFRDVP